MNYSKKPAPSNRFPEDLYYYFDFQADARDMEINGDFHFIEDGVSV